MTDESTRMTEEELAKLEKRIEKVYKEAAESLTKTVDDYFKSFKKRDEAQRAKLEAGEITEEYYKQWRLNQIGRGKRFEALRDKLAERMTDAKEVAMSYVNDETPGIYSLNRNYAAYLIEQVSDAADFTLWDESTVRRLIVEEPDVMPYYPPERAVQRGIDIAYGKSQITKNVTSSILQGHSVDRMANDLMDRVTTMSRTSAIRAARTSVTSAQNAGRMDTYAAAQKRGIKIKKQWLATLDNRTRHAHQKLDGQKRDINQTFSSELGDIMFPGDPKAKPANLYCCRCTLISVIEGRDTSKAKRRASDQKTGKWVLIKDMTYEEWEAWKRGGGNGNNS